MKDELVQELTDKIQLITKDQIISKIIKSGSGADNYFQYYLNADAKSVTKQIYKKIMLIGQLILNQNITRQFHLQN